MGFPGDTVVKNLPAKSGGHGFVPWVGKIPWRRKWQLTPIFLPGKSHGLMKCPATGLKRVRHQLSN